MFDEEHGVISEAYDSWYEVFRVIRLSLKEVPAYRIDEAQGLIEITTGVLNKGLRPHLTRWQARYRKWYKEEENTSNELPQDIQKRCPDYELLVQDLRKTNEIMINYATELKRIVDG